MADNNPIKIDQLQSISWAQEVTLRQLKDKVASDSTLVTIATALGVSEEILEKIQKESVKTNTNATLKSKNDKSNNQSMLDTFSSKSEKNVSAINILHKNLGESFGRLSQTISSGDPKSILTAFSGGLKSNNYLLHQMEGILPKIVIGIGAAFESFELLSHTVIDLNKSYLEALSSGVNFTGGIMGMNKAAAETGLSLEKYLGIVNKFGAVFAQLGSGAVTRVNNQFNKLTENGADLQMSQEEAAKGFMDYLEIQKNAGTLTRMSDVQLAAGAKDFLNNINELSRISGKSRDELLNQAKEISRDPVINALMANLPGDAAKRLQDGFSQLGVLPAEINGRLKAVATAFTAGGQGFANAADENLTILAAQTNTQREYNNLLNAIKNNGNIPEAIKGWNEAMNNSTLVQRGGLLQLQKAMPEVAKAFGEIRVASNGLADAQKMQEIADKDAREQGYKNAAELNAQQRTTQASIAEFNKSFSNLSAAFSNIVYKVFTPILIPAFNFIASSVNKFASGVDIAFDTISWFGDKIKSVMGVFGDDVGAASKSAFDFGVGLVALTASVAALKIGFSAISSLFSLGGGALNKLPIARLTGLGGPAIAGEGEAASMLGKIGKGIGGSISAIASGISTGFSSIVSGIGSSFVTVTKAIGAGFAAIMDGIGSSFASIIKYLSSGVASLVDGLSSSFASIAKGLGSGLGGLLQGIGGGLAALGPEAPMIAAGAAAVGAAISLIGAGVAGATWIMGAALPKFAEGLSAFDKVNGDNLKDVGAGMEALGVGLLAFGAGNVLNAFSGVMNGILKFFGVDNDPITQLKRFGEVADPLNSAAPALTIFSSAFKLSMDTLSSTKIDGIEAAFDVIKGILSQDFGTLFGSQPKIIGQINDLADSIGNFIAKTNVTLGNTVLDQLNAILTGVSDMAAKINSISLNGFAQSFSDSIDLMQKATLNSETLKTMDQIKSFLGADYGTLFGGQPKIIGQINDLSASVDNLLHKSTNTASNNTSNTVVTNNIATPAADVSDLQKRTMMYYDDQKISNDSIIALLSAINVKLDQLNETNSDGHDGTIRAIKNTISGIF